MKVVWIKTKQKKSQKRKKEKEETYSLTVVLFVELK